MQVCVSVMRASTIDRDWKLTKRTAREREKDRERASERERESGQRGKRRARQLTFSVLLCSYSSPFVRFPQVLSHDDSVCRFLKPSWLQMDDFSRCRNSVLCHLQECLFKTHTQTDTHATVSVILRFVVYVCARVCACWSCTACRSFSAVCYTRLERLLSVATLLTFARWRHSSSHSQHR